MGASKNLGLLQNIEMLKSGKRHTTELVPSFLYQHYRGRRNFLKILETLENINPTAEEQGKSSPKARGQFYQRLFY